MAETEETHRAAFNQAFAEAGLDWNWTEDDYRALLTTTGGRERIARYMRQLGHAPAPLLIAELHQRKNMVFAERVASGAVAPRPGVVPLIAEARARGVRLAIATTTSRSNLTALLNHGFANDAAGWFAAVATGEDVARKKPHPEVFQQTLDRLSLGPAACVAIEDSRNGLEAAIGAGLATLVTPSRYTIGERFTGAAFVAEPSAGCRDITVDFLEQLAI